MSSLIGAGPNVKPYVSKRQREKLVQATSLSLVANEPLQDIDLTLRNGSLNGANYHPDEAESSKPQGHRSSMQTIKGVAFKSQRSHTGYQLHQMECYRE